MSTITKYQIKKIHILKSLLCIDDDLYHEMLSDFAVKSSKDLSYEEASILLDILENQAAEQNLWEIKPKKYENLNHVGNKVTPSQLRMIEGIWRDICYFDNDEFARKSLRKFLAIKFKIFDVTQITKAKASKVIQGILAIKKKIKESPQLSKVSRKIKE